MSRFGWAYVNDVITGSGPGGSDKAIQFASGSTFSGSTNFTFDYTTNTVRLTGTLYADTLIVSSSTIYKSGSTKFGDDSGDTHQFTGSIYNTTLVSGSTARFTTISGSVVSASTYYGLPTFSSTPGGVNTNIQFNSGSTFSGSSNLTYNYSTNNLSLTGALLMSGTSYISGIDYIDFDVSASVPTYKHGRTFTDLDTGDLTYYLPYASQKLQIGQQTVVKSKNSTGSPISKGSLVRIVGGVGDNPLIATASWENDSNSANTLGMLMSTVAHNDFGYVLLNGVLTGINTDPATFTAGQVVYLSSSGTYTTTVPVAPKHTVRIGEVVRAHASVGSIFVKIDNGYELDELHNILITSASTGDLLTYNSSSALWTNTKSLSGSYTLTGSLSASSTINALSLTSNNASVPKIIVDGSTGFEIVNDYDISTALFRIEDLGDTLAPTIYLGNSLSPASLIYAYGDFEVSNFVSSPYIYASTQISASSYIGNGANIVNIQATNITGSGNDWAIQFKNGTTKNITGSANLTFTGSNLILTGSLYSTSAIKGGYLIYSSSVSIPNTSYFVGFYSNSGVLTASLLAANNYPQGQMLIFKDVGGYAGTNNILIKASGSETIDGASGVSLTANSSSVSLISNGSNAFYIVGIV